MNEILVVDDDLDLLNSIKRTLARRGYNVTVFDDPHESLTLLKQNPHRFDAILLDWKLNCPLDGDMVIDLIYHKFPDFKTPIVFVTAHTHIASKYLLKHGAFETLKKPFKVEELMDAIERALGKKSSEDPHRKAPAELSWQQLRKHEILRKIISAIRSHSSLEEAAKSLNCTEMSLRRWIRRAKLHDFLIRDYQHKRKDNT